MRIINKILVIGFNPEEASYIKETIRGSLEQKNATRRYFLASVRPTEGNLAGLRNVENLKSVIVTSEVESLLLETIKRNCRAEVFTTHEIETFLKNLE